MDDGSQDYPIWVACRGNPDLPQSYDLPKFYGVIGVPGAGRRPRGAVAAGRSVERVTIVTHNVAVMVGDWTDGDPKLGRFIEAHNRAGVPLYLFYKPGATEPEVLPQVLTPAMLSELAVQRIAAPFVLQCRNGFEPRAVDHRDVAALCARFGPEHPSRFL